ncbi:GGDEF and EAL domain-containing protein [Arthrobacter sp. CAN_C5]|uniref:sensor domain-containing protein n=1 Tax=Arthrobacter sp. CAN_C5 TaxID=2760706 RepID=UPI001AE4A1AB|nr:GGDEF and EAL domain-containing protein [Arthrobacter sp. CAN_C5]MBP2218325.1 diguanylate cyclase (GGDEF)-like protein/PAS domain S-box-containing protein [Arthrobacter sp. CAN_C5]
MNGDGLDYEALFQQAPCGYLLTDDDGTITAVNGTFLSWSGYARADLLATPLHQLLPASDQFLYTMHCVPQLHLIGSVEEQALEVIGRDGVRRAALLSATRVPPSGCTPAMVRVGIFGAHQRRRYEEHLLEARRQAEESEARCAAAEAVMRRLASHDPLTGLLNRPALVTALDAALAGVAPGRRTVVFFVDLDHFKAVNDSLGHAAGDELLSSVARRLQVAARDPLCIARLSGDEFVVVAAVSGATAVDEVGQMAERLLGALQEPLVIEGLEVVVSASIGAAVCEDGDAAERLLRRSDIAMYQAKASGRNTWELHDPSQSDPAVDRLQLVGELRHAISDGELRVYYQPRVNLRDGRLTGVEALVRWEHPRRGLLPPSEFIGLAEESGVIRELGAWVLNEVVAQAVRWADEDPNRGPVEMAVNLSTRQLADPELPRRVASVLGRHGFDPSLLTLELTETSLMVGPEAALRALSALKALGVGLAVDDFGTGYSSLTYLRQFPIDELKIDRSFVSGLGINSGDSAIVASCVQLAHAVGIKAVAEGVETEGQREALIGLDCDLAQGYHYARPLPAEELASWFAMEPVVPVQAVGGAAG